MSDSSERLHLEGLDEATERERWEEATSPARDDARREAEGSWKNWVPSMFADDENMHTAYVAGYMAAPDELTALLRAREDDVDRLIDERDALRERIRALADELEQCARPCYCEHSKNARDLLRAALGDA